jgi:hypothetical protein
VESRIVTYASLARRQLGVRARILALLGPLTVLGGLLWAFAQPYRITLLHPRGQGFWWLLIEPPLLVIGVGLLFSYAIARPLIADIEEADGTEG